VTDSLAQTGVPDPLEEQLVVALPRLRAHLRARGRRIPGGEVEDVLQEVMARALRYQGSFDGSRALWPWLRRLADHVIHDHFSAQARRPALSENLDPSAPEGEASLDLREEVERLLSQLPARERSVLLRFHHHGQAVRTISREMGLPEGTVRSHLSRARRRLAGIDKPDDGAPCSTSGPRSTT